MPKIYKPGKVGVLLQGRQAGKKVVVIQQYDDGNRERAFPHLIVAGVERYPLKVTRSMGAKKLAKRSKVKPFIKVSIRSRRTKPHSISCAPRQTMKTAASC